MELPPLELLKTCVLTTLCDEQGDLGHIISRGLFHPQPFSGFFLLAALFDAHIQHFVGLLVLFFFFQNNLLKMHSISVQIKTQTMHII